MFELLKRKDLYSFSSVIGRLIDRIMTRVEIRVSLTFKE